GSKNDPADNTGLSHYLEHLMFKGTDRFGTKDYSKEKPLLDKIDNLFEVYRAEKDTNKRKQIYIEIDSISGLAAQHAIPNEYDKMVGVLGAKGTNAYTSNEVTAYINDIPSNQLETWLDIESERFRNPVFRLFHTELETVYEESNMYADRDERKIEEALMAGLFQKHQYGTQTTIGKTEHLKNPSLLAIKKYYSERYLPNNMAICLAGDFNPDVIIKLIDEKFGGMKMKDIKPYIPPVEYPIAQPIVKEVLGPDAESVDIGFRFPGTNTKETDLLEITDMILSNSVAGLIDINLIQEQKVLSAVSFTDIMKDYSIHEISGKSKEGQKLEDVKDLLLSQIEIIKKGEFPDWLIPAIINDFKLNEIKQQESNRARASEMTNAFITETPWTDEVNKIERLSKITKQDVMEFAKKYYGDNYVVVYKRTGVDKNVVRITKPHITPLKVNRTDQSEFLKQITSKEPAIIEPVFIDFSKDMKKLKMKSNIEVFYKENTENKLFNLNYNFDMGSNNNNKLAIALDYLDYLGTSKLTPAQVKQEFYKIGCSLNTYASEDKVSIGLTGLAENMTKGMQLLENILADAQPNEDALKNMVSDMLKTRANNKLNKGVILQQAMVNYGKYGAKSPYTNVLSESELKSLKPEDLLSVIKTLNSYHHHVLYYGLLKSEELVKVLNQLHNVPAQLKSVPPEITFTELATDENKVYVADYNMKQVELIMLSKSVAFSKDIVPAMRLFNEYFGNGMSSIVFQELREAKALAYTARAYYGGVNRKDKSFYISTFIGTQNDKLPEAMKGMKDLIDNMPESNKSFETAKQSVLNQIRTERITKMGILSTYENMKRLGIDYDLRKDVYAKVPSMTFADVKAFEEKYMKNKNFTVLALGKKDQLDINSLQKYGNIKYLSMEEIFGY
ncbi:MAG: insulinase family protein, partial [Bacteroidales bacterium]